MAGNGVARAVVVAAACGLVLGGAPGQAATFTASVYGFVGPHSVVTLPEPWQPISGLYAVMSVTRSFDYYRYVPAYQGSYA
jgi:hypothetical protein